ncbi:hypothetical protein [Salisediminibacterium halotolerans]|uniref:hypothetical protein n=1 Tax=Salisediminibacterium halotolerans TaxID=517425 RepID=UPI00131599A7|nr:hypothetical protein [Salisediminibacterium halotolerans]
MISSDVSLYKGLRTRHRPPYVLRASAEMLGHPLRFKRRNFHIVLQSKKAEQPLLRRLRESKRRRSGFGGLRPPNAS